MTILSCQKRHHKPHYVLAYPRSFMCDGLPQWPYARPKPPRISSVAYPEYQLNNKTITATKERRINDQWNVIAALTDDLTGHVDRRLMMAAREATTAITYAQKLAQERKQQHGLVQSR